MLLALMNVVSVLLALATTALATPLAITLRDAVSPPITNPTAQTVWRVGDTVTVTWDVAALNGAQPSNPLAKILLGTFADNVEHLMIDSPLASNFPILGGNVSLVVPSVPSGSDYIVCLLGSSGDISPAFQIIGADASPQQTLAASTHNTLPPHQTTDRTTSVNLPTTGVTRTDPAPTSSSGPTSVSITTSASVSVTSGILPSGVSGTSGSVTSSGTSSNATSTSASSTGSSAATGAAGNGGSNVRLTRGHLFSAILCAVALLIFL